MKKQIPFIALLLFFLIIPSWALQELVELQVLVPELSIHTSFAHDYGDRLDHVVYKNVRYEPHEASRKILPQLNWKDRPDKLELGSAWAKVFGLHGCRVLPEDHDRMPRGGEGPKAEILEDGTFQYTAWVMILTGRSPGGVAHRTVRITPEGEIISLP